MSHVESLNRVPLTFPSLIQLAAKPAEGEAPKSWIQLAVIGSFKSNRYGPFEITTTDLSQMEFNWRNITPKAPTQIPVDFDHMSMDPKRPGDGVAAGWVTNVELRADGEELWGEIEWTVDAAELIRKGAYKFISPSFIKDHTHKDGKKIGTTLLAAAVTNHPFLEGMKAVTLFNFSAMGDLGLVDTAPGSAMEAALHLAEIGQRLVFKQKPSDIEVPTGTFTVVEEDDDHYVRVASLDGKPLLGWHALDDFDPAEAPDKHAKENNPMSGTKTTVDLSQIVAANDVAKAAKRMTDEQAKAYFEQFDSGALKSEEPVAERPAASEFHLRTLPGERFPQLVDRVARERGISLREAITVVGIERPDLAEKYANGDLVA